MIRRNIIIFIGLAFFISCAPKLKYLSTSKTFNKASISNATIGFMPVVSKIEVKDEDVKRVEEIILGEFNKEFREIKIIKPEEVRIAKPKNLNKALESFKDKGVVPKELLENLVETHKMDFIVFARLTDHRSENKEKEYTSESGDFVDMITKTHLAGNLIVYNASTKESVWDASHEVKKEEKNSYEKDRLLMTVINWAAKRKTEYKYPAPLSIIDMAPKLFSDFFANWPKKEK